MLLLRSPASHPRAETCWPLSQCYKFLQAAAPWTSPKAIPRVGIASQSLNCLSFSPHYEKASHQGCPDLLSHSHLSDPSWLLQPQWELKVWKLPFLCQTAAGNLRRHWPTPATSEREGGRKLRSHLQKYLQLKKNHKWWLSNCWGRKLMSAEMVYSVSCTDPKREDKWLRRVLGCLSTLLNINYWAKAEMLDEIRTTS